MPMMRALALLYQDDARARAAKDEYLFGPDFLVAPVIDEGTQRTVYLPAGEWVGRWWWRTRRWIRFRCGRGQAR
jgi:alpha-D-xyloside xylohydrolase